MPGTEEVLINGGLYHSSCLDGTLREAELREQRKRLYRGEWGREPPWGRAVRVLAPLGLAESYIHLILQGGIHPCSWEQGGRGPSRTRHPRDFPMLSARRFPPGAPKTFLTLSYPINNFPANIWDSDSQTIRGLPAVTPESSRRCLLSSRVLAPAVHISFSAALRGLMWVF